VQQIRGVRGTAYGCKRLPEAYRVIDSTSIDLVGPIDPPVNPYIDTSSPACADASEAGQSEALEVVPVRLLDRPEADEQTVIRLPAYEQVRDDPALYAHASRILHKETNPYNARPLVQAHGDRDVWLNPPPIPLETEELDLVFEQPYTRLPHSSYGDARIPAYEMIRHSVNIMRGCFGGCTFCSITEHEGRIIQNRSED
ncbi:unnamed protein product, partial [Laminaria digitata]